MNQENATIEGQSLGRHDDSEITEPQQESTAQEQKVSEEEMLETAEAILRRLADKLLENKWSFKEVFDHPKLVHIIPSYEGTENVKALSANNFLGRLYQCGL